MKDSGSAELKFRDPARAGALVAALTRAVEAIDRDPVSIMHVCGSHEQAIARFGLRATLPRRLNVIMGPGYPLRGFRDDQLPGDVTSPATRRIAAAARSPTA